MTSTPVRDRNAMIAGMAPVLRPGAFVFCTTKDVALARRAAHDAVGQFREDEGLTLILSLNIAQAFGFPADQPMAQITLNVHSALDGVGLTAAVATALADAGIPCNMVAAYYHDHVFVPAGLASQAVEILQALAAQAAKQG